MTRLNEKLLISAVSLVIAACSAPHAEVRRDANGREIPNPPVMTAPAGTQLCVHMVPMTICTRCHPKFVEEFRSGNDWCADHDVAESQCFRCNPDLDFRPMPPLPPGADAADLAVGGADVPELAVHAAKDKVTVFDFSAAWCVPCRKVERHMRKIMTRRQDVAWRRLDVANWDTPLSKHYLAHVQSLPYLMIYGRDGQLIREINAADLPALDAAIAEGMAR